MKRSLPLVTIGIPTYNRASLVGRAIDSALAQDYPQLEIVVSNNASADGTEEACLARVAADSRLRYVQQDRNIGATRNFEEVLRLASGDYFMWLGDDDWIDPNYVRLCLGALTDDVGMALVGGVPHYYENGVGKGPGQSLSLAQHAWWRRILAYFWQVRDNGVFYGLARTDVLRTLLPIRNVMGGDWLHIARLASKGRVCTLDSTRVHREMGGATTSYDQIARSLGLHPVVGRFPFTFIAWSAFADVAWRHRAYSSHWRSARWMLALAVACSLVCRGAIVASAPARMACWRAISALSFRPGG